MLFVDLGVVLLMDKILHHLGCMKPYKYWDKLPINWCRISSINSIIPATFFFLGWVAERLPFFWISCALGCVKAMKVSGCANVNSTRVWSFLQLGEISPSRWANQEIMSPQEGEWQELGGIFPFRLGQFFFVFFFWGGELTPIDWHLQKDSQKNVHHEG